MLSRTYYVIPNEYWTPFIYQFYTKHITECKWAIMVESDIDFDQFVFNLSDLDLLSREPTMFEVIVILKEKIE